MRRVTPRGRQYVLIGIAAAWLVLAGLNFSRGHANIAVVYGVVGILSLGLAYFFRPRGRRSR